MERYGERHKGYSEEAEAMTWGHAMICPYCSGANTIIRHEKSRLVQLSLTGEKEPLEVKLKLPKCKSCNNVIRYYLDGNGNKRYIRNLGGI